MISSGDALKSLALEAALSPQEEKLRWEEKNKSYTLVFQENGISRTKSSLGSGISWPTCRQRSSSSYRI